MRTPRYGLWTAVVEIMANGTLGVIHEPPICFALEAFPGAACPSFLHRLPDILEQNYSACEPVVLPRL
jgi:hypothetical protein